MALRVADPAAVECAIADQARVQLERILSENPLTIVILYETAGSSVGHMAIPATAGVLNGLVRLKVDELDIME